MKQTTVNSHLTQVPPGLPRRQTLIRLAALLALSVSQAFSQGISVSTEDLRFQVVNPKPKGSLIEQLNAAKDKVKGKVFRYRIFVRPEAETGLFSSLLRGSALISIIRVAAFPQPNQKISLEAVTSGGNNPQGLVFISGQGVSRNETAPKVRPMAETAFGNIDKALSAVQLTPADVVAVTCYLSSLDDVAEVQSLAAARYPKSANNHLQIPIGFRRALVECEAVARAKGPVGFVSPEGLVKSPNFSHAAGISTKKMVWSGVHAAPDCSEAGVRKMFQDLDATLKKNGADIRNVAFSYVYPNSQQGTDLTRAIRFEFYNKAQPPASTLITFSGVENKNACTAVEVAAQAQ